jgi:hypothetical protein
MSLGLEPATLRFTAETRSVSRVLRRATVSRCVGLFEGVAVISRASHVGDAHSAVPNATRLVPDGVERHTETRLHHVGGGIEQQRHGDRMLGVQGRVERLLHGDPRHRAKWANPRRRRCEPRGMKALTGRDAATVAASTSSSPIRRMVVGPAQVEREPGQRVGAERLRQPRRVRRVAHRSARVIGAAPACLANASVTIVRASA